MNSQNNLDNPSAVVARVIPRRLHCFSSQKLVPKNKKCPLITKRSFSFSSFNIVIHNKLNSRAKKQSSKILKNLKTNHLLSSLSFRYGYKNVNEIAIVADTIKNFKRLTSLRLRILNESTSLEKFNHLARSLRFLTSLETLDFVITYEDSPSVQDFKLTDTLKHMRNLRNLSLNFSWSKSIRVARICEGLKTMQRLDRLALLFSMVNIENEDAIVLANCLASLKNLTHLKLDLSSNSISLSGLQALLLSLKKLPDLTELELVCNKNLILAENLSFFKEAMQSLKKLEVLELNFSNLKIFKNSIKDFGDGLAFLTSLRVLKVSLSDCHLNEKHIANIGKGISELTMLTEIDFDLTHNELYDKETLEFIEYLRPLKGIKSFNLSLSQNLIGDWVLNALGRMLSNYPSLEKVALNGFSCKWTDKGIEKLSVLTGKLYNLRELTLIFNNNKSIRDEGVKKFMDKLVQAKGLKEIRIDFADCKLSQDLEDFYLDELRKELPNCHTTLLFGY